MIKSLHNRQNCWRLFKKDQQKITTAKTISRRHFSASVMVSAGFYIHGKTLLVGHRTERQLLATNLPRHTGATDEAAFWPSWINVSAGLKAGVFRQFYNCCIPRDVSRLLCIAGKDFAGWKLKRLYHHQIVLFCRTLVSKSLTFFVWFMLVILIYQGLVMRWNPHNSVETR